MLLLLLVLVLVEEREAGAEVVRLHTSTLEVLDKEEVGEAHRALQLVWRGAEEGR